MYLIGCRQAAHQLFRSIDLAQLGVQIVGIALPQLGHGIHTSGLQQIGIFPILNLLAD